MGTKQTPDSGPEHRHEAGEQEALLASELRYRRLFESAQHGILILDAETGMVTDVNPFMINLLGHSREAFLTKKVWELGFLGDAIANEDVFRELQATGYVRYEDLPLKTSDGQGIEVEFVSNVYEENERPVIQCNIRDVTERKQIEQELRRLAARQKDLLAAVPSILMEVDLNKVCTWANQESLDFFGEDVIGSEAASYFEGDQDTHDLVAPLFDGSVDLVRVESWQRRKDGEVRLLSWVCRTLRDEAGDLTGVLSSARDITERKQAEEALRQSEEWYRVLVEQAGGSIILSDPTGRILDVNVEICDTLGYAREELLGKSVALIDPEATTTRWQDMRSRVLAGEHAHISSESQHLRKDGSSMPVEVTLSALDLSDGQAVLGVARDITERKQAEAERERLQVQLNQALRMESVGRLAGGVAHDFNNMLGIILGYTELALEGVGSDEPLHANLEEIRRVAQRSADLTRRLLAFARKQPVALEVLDLNATVENMLNMLRQLIGEDIDLAWKPGRGLWPVNMDPAQIDQILVNLCANARDAIAGVGTISVETRNTTLDEEYCAQRAGSVPGQYVMLTVSDDGCGMDAETLLNLFEPFFTSREEGTGTGLGLATVYGIVKQNNGYIYAYSEPDQGATFNIYLPRYAAKTEPLPEGVPVQTTVRGHETVLLAEDNAEILAITTIMLERQGYTVLKASTPGEAIRLASEHTGRIDVLLTDVIMPEMNGRELAENIASIHADIKRIFMSGYSASVITEPGGLKEGEHFIQKPFSVNDLGAKLREALEG